MSREWLVCFAGLVASGCVPHLTSSNPVDPGDWSWESPTNRWGVSPPPSGTVGVGFQAGQTPPDFRLVDQFGEEVSLWQFYGSVILFDVSTLWCGPCQALGEHTEETWLDYKDDGFVYLTIIQEDLEGHPTGPEDVAAWVDGFGITAPVLADPDKVAASALQNGQYPSVLTIDRDLKVAERLNSTDDDTVRDAIEDLL